MNQRAEMKNDQDTLTESMHPSLNRFTNNLQKLTVQFNKILHKVSGVLLMVLMFLTAADILGRYFFNAPIKGTYELTGLFLALMIFYSLGSGQLKNKHIEIDFFTQKLSKKTQVLLRSVTSFLLSVLLGLTSWQLIEYSIRLYISGETSGDLALPLYVFPALAIPGAIAFALTLLLDGFRSLLKVVNGDES